MAKQGLRSVVVKKYNHHASHGGLKKWEYKVTHVQGLHIRPAGLLVREAGKYQSRIVLEFQGQTADARDMMELLDLDVKCGQTVAVTVSGEDEEAACQGIQRVLEAGCAKVK